MVITDEKTQLKKLVREVNQEAAKYTPDWMKIAKIAAELRELSRDGLREVIAQAAGRMPDHKG